MTQTTIEISNYPIFYRRIIDLDMVENSDQ